MIDTKATDLVQMAKQVNVHEFAILNSLLGDPQPRDGSVEMDEIIENLIEVKLITIIAYDGIPNCYALTNLGLELYNTYMELAPTQTKRGIYPTMVG